MNLQSLIFFLALSILIIGCDFGMDKVYSEMAEVIEANNSTLETSIESKISAMEDMVKRKPDYKPTVPAAKEIQSITLDFIEFLNKVNGHFDNKEFRKIDGNQIKEKSIITKQKVIETLNTLADNRTLGIKKDEIEALSVKHIFLNRNLPQINGKNWKDYNFRRQSVEANKNALSKLENDALMAAKQSIDYLASKIGATATIFEKFVVVNSPEKSHIIKGETYESHIFLSAASSQAKVTVKVDGKELEVERGVATFKTRPTKYGEHKYEAEITVTNPYNNKTETYKETFKYEVGERCY